MGFHYSKYLGWWKKLIDLSRSEMFQGLSRVNQARLLGSLEKMTVPEATTIFQDGDPGDSMYIIEQGQVQIYTLLADGKKHPLALLREGDIFGEMALLTGQPRSAAAEVQSDAILYRLQTEKFQEFLDQNQVISSSLLKLLCQRLGQTNDTMRESLDQRLTNARKWLDGLDTAKRKAILFLLQLPNPLHHKSLICAYVDDEGLPQWLDSTDEIEPFLKLSNSKAIRDKLTAQLLPADHHLEISRFLDFAASYYIENGEPQQALQIYIYHDDWEHAVSLYLSHIDEFGNLGEEEQNEWMEDFRGCPLSLLKQHVEFAAVYFTYFQTHHPETALKQIEDLLHDPEGLSHHQLADLYRWAADCCEQLDIKQKALEYLNMAKRMNEQKTSAEMQQTHFYIERSNLESAQNQAKAKKARQPFQRNLVAASVSIVGSLTALLWFGWLSEPIAGLSPQAMWFIGITVAAVIFWIVDWIPDYIVALFMGLGWVLAGITTTEGSLVGYASPAWLFMIFIFGLSIALTKTGLLYRMSLWTLKLFPKNYAGQLLGIAASGILISPLIPSATAKAALSAPIAKNIAEAMGFRDGSRGSAGLGLAAMIFHGFLFPFFLTSSFLNILALGIVDREVSWLSWLFYGLPALLIFCTGMYVFILLFYKPDVTPKKLPVELIQQQLAVMGKLTGKEKITILLTIGSVLLLMTQGLHGLETTWIMLLSFAFLILSGVLTTQNLKSDIEWGFLIFIGMTFSFAEVATQVGVVDKMGEAIIQVMNPFLDTPVLFLLAIAVITLCTSFFIKDDPALILLAVALSPLAVAANIDPWVIVFTILVTLSPFFFPYQSSTYLSAYYSSEGKAFTHRQAKSLSIAFAIIGILAILLSIPFWRWLGLL